jgi:hypothetical protein
VQRYNQLKGENMSNGTPSLPDPVVNAVKEFARIRTEIQLKTPPPAPTKPKTTPSSNSIKLDWIYPPNAQAPLPQTAADHFEIERKDSPSSDFTVVAQVAAPQGNTNITFTDTGLNSATTYQYRIRVINISGDGVSEIATVKTN